MMKIYRSGLSSTFLLGAVSLLFLIACSVNADQGKKENIDLGSWTEPKLDRMMEQKAQKTGAPEQIDFLSAEFLGTPYAHHTLTGDIK